MSRVGEMAKEKLIKIVTEYWAKPIQSRQFDWSAVDDIHGYEAGEPIGFGATEREAVESLWEQKEELT